MSCKLLGLCQYETNKLVRIQSVRLGSLKWSLNALILLCICLMMLWNRKYQEVDLVVSSVTTKLKGVAASTLPGLGEVLWDVVDYSGPAQEKNSFFVVTNVIITNNQKQGKCAEDPQSGRACRSDKDCEKGFWDQHSHGVQTGACVNFDVGSKTCEVSAWCPVEARRKPPRPALLAAAENFTVLIKNNIRFPAFNFIRRNILPQMSDSFLRRCSRSSEPLCPVFRLGDVVREAGESFADMAVEGGVIAVQINWDCDLDRLTERCLPKYSFRRLDEKQSNRTLHPGLNLRFARYRTASGVELRTLYKAFGIRFDVMVFGQAGRFSWIQLIIYIGSTLSYYALTTVFIDWLIGTSCYSAEARQNYGARKVEDVHDRQQVILSVSFVDENHVRLVKKPQRKSLQHARAIGTQQRKEDAGHLSAMSAVLQRGISLEPPPTASPGTSQTPKSSPGPDRRPRAPAWCSCGSCSSSDLRQEELCCRRSRGPCIASSPLFEQLVLSRPLLEAVLLYRDPLEPLEARGGRTAALRHCAYEQLVRWRFGAPAPDRRPALPRCCVGRIRAEFPSPDGRYRGLRPTRVEPTRPCSNGMT